MKNRFTVLFLSAIMLVTLTACMRGNESAANIDASNIGQGQMSEPSTPEKETPSEPDKNGDPSDAPQEPDAEGQKILVAFFSQTGNTVPLAEYAADIIAESNLHAMMDDTVQWLTGARFAAGTSKDTIQEWIDSLGVLE